MNTTANRTEYIVCAPDGREARVYLTADTGAAPRWLPALFGFDPDPAGGWQLRGPGTRPGAVAMPPRVLLVRTTTAGASGAPRDPRQARLRTERLRMEQLNKDSDYVRVELLDILEGSEPEHYRVTFICRGITGIDSARRPIYAEKHQVEILCDDDFPSDVPRLRWITPIWHPNIQHGDAKGVCVNKAEWLGGMGLDDLCRLMFEMVQYKNYHATFNKPFPLDMEVARWVLEYAEPNGIVDKKRKIPVDDKPFTRPTVTKNITVSERPQGRVRLVPNTSPPPATTRIRVADSAPKLDNASDKSPRIKVVENK